MYALPDNNNMAIADLYNGEVVNGHHLIKSFMMLSKSFRNAIFSLAFGTRGGKLSVQ